MPWWSWLLIWGGLVLALLAMLVLLAVWLFRKSMGLLEDLAALADTATVLDVDEPVLEPRTVAVLAGLRDTRAREQERRAHRSRARNDRHRRRMERARRITSPGAARRQWPADWY